MRNEKALRVTRLSRFAFDAAVMLEINGDRIVLDNMEDAEFCLANRFPEPWRASCQRALGACEACRTGTGTATAVRVTLVVAAMEAGFRFEVIDDPELALERRTEIEAEKALRSILMDGVGNLDAD